MQLFGFGQWKWMISNKSSSATSESLWRTAKAISNNEFSPTEMDESWYSGKLSMIASSRHMHWTFLYNTPCRVSQHWIPNQQERGLGQNKTAPYLSHCENIFYCQNNNLQVLQAQQLSCKETYRLPTPLNILLCNLPSFHKHYSNENPCRAPSRSSHIWLNWTRQQ